MLIWIKLIQQCTNRTLLLLCPYSIELPNSLIFYANPQELPHILGKGLLKEYLTKQYLDRNQ